MGTRFAKKFFLGETSKEMEEARNSFFDQIGEDCCTNHTKMLESERLNLNIEVFSEECGCCFQEHYVIKQGILEIDECVDYYEFCKEDYKSKAEAEKALKTEITDEEWNNDDTYIIRGGFEWDFEI